MRGEVGRRSAEMKVRGIRDYKMKLKRKKKYSTEERGFTLTLSLSIDRICG